MAMADPTSSDENLLSTVDNGVGWIVLNRPRALNALTLEMIRKMTKLLEVWNKEGSCVKVIVVKGAGDRAFCSGGDVKSIAKSKGEQMQKDFIREEYKLDYLIGSLTVPYISILDGITMGGGVGISVNGRFRVGTERTVFAMPECAIGLIPDCGSGYFLTQLEGKLGLFLGLSGHRVTGWECLRFGITTHAIKSDMLEQLEQQIKKLADKEETLSNEDIQQLLDTISTDKGKENDKGCIAEHLDTINNLFAADTLEEIITNLQQDNSEFSMSTYRTMLNHSPTSMKLTFLQLKEGRSNLADALTVEHRLMTRRFQDSDFYEGVRAALIDKDQKPVWNPPSMEEVNKDIIDTYFSELESDQELVF